MMKCIQYIRLFQYKYAHALTRMIWILSYVIYVTSYLCIKTAIYPSMLLLLAFSDASRRNKQQNKMQKKGAVLKNDWRLKKREILCDFLGYFVDKRWGNVIHSKHHGCTPYIKRTRYQILRWSILMKFVHFKHPMHFACSNLENITKSEHHFFSLASSLSCNVKQKG